MTSLPPGRKQLDKYTLRRLAEWHNLMAKGFRARSPGNFTHGKRFSAYADAHEASAKYARKLAR